MNGNSKKTRLLVFNALFIALMIVMQLTGIGLINLGVISITFYCTLIAICTLTLGLPSGLLLGFVFASISVYRAISAPSGLVAPILSRSVVLIVLMSYIPRLLVPIVTYLIYKLIARNGKDKTAMAVGAACGSATNTALYLGLMMVFYIPMLKDYPAVAATIGGVVLYGGIPEAIAAGLVAPIVTIALRKVMGKKIEGAI